MLRSRVSSTTSIMVATAIPLLLPLQPLTTHAEVCLLLDMSTNASKRSHRCTTTASGHRLARFSVSNSQQSCMHFQTSMSGRT